MLQIKSSFEDIDDTDSLLDDIYSASDDIDIDIDNDNDNIIKIQKMINLNYATNPYD